MKSSDPNDWCYFFQADRNDVGKTFVEMCAALNIFLDQKTLHVGADTVTLMVYNADDGSSMSVGLYCLMMAMASYRKWCN